MHDIRLQVFDDVHPDPVGFRERTLAGTFETKTGPDGGVYTGIQVLPAGAFDAELSQLLGRPVKSSLNFFRLNKGGEKPHNKVHTDQICDDFAAIYYMNLPEQCRGGTALWRHKKFGWTALPTQDEIRARGKSPKRLLGQIDADWDREDAWELADLVEMKFNRLAVYPTRRFHSRWPWAAFGDTNQNGRLILVAFFSEA